MRNLKSVLVLSAACILALPGCPEDEEPVTKTEVCDNNNVDDDGDSKADCADTDCATAANCQAKQEICDNTIDDDADGEFDCDDPDCDAAANCQTTAENCNNGNVDDDGDGKADCADSDCTNAANCQAVECTANETECGSDCCAKDTETCVDGACVAVNPGNCTIPSNYASVTVTGDVEAEGTAPQRSMVMIGELPSSTDTTADYIQLELWEGSGVYATGFTSGPVTLTAADLNYKTCGLCLRIFSDVTNTTSGAQFFATGAGSVNISFSDTALTATLTDVTFTEVTVASDFTSTPVENGCQSTIASAAFNGTLAGGEICDDANGDDEDNDGDANCADSDCATHAACAGDVCDPLAPNCATGEGCYFDGAAYTCATAGTADIGDPCETGSDCTAGSECMNAGGVATCMQLCGTGVPCGVGSTCYEFEAPLGVCVVTEICGNLTDDDDDNAIDCADSDCAADAGCATAACSAAIPVTPGTVVNGDTSTGTAAFEGSCTGEGKGVVYAVTVGTASDTAVAIQAKVTSTSDDVDVGVYIRSTCGDATSELVCSDKFYKGTEIATVGGVAGGTYYVVVDTYESGAEGAFTLDIATSVCGDGTVAAGEECEPADGSTCLPNCRMPESSCNDLIDSDLDGATDCRDSDCNCTPGAGLVGTACTNYTECASSTGNDPFCASELLVNVPHGYCTEFCNLAADDCPTGSKCMDYGISSTVGICMTSCTADADCGAAQGCYTNQGVCWSGCSTDDDCDTGICNSWYGRCVPEVCGDSSVVGAETCDDGNADSGDGCSATCQLEAGYACPDAGAPCKPTVCGDGVVEGLETCEDDDGATPQAGDGCDASCHVETGFICPAPSTACVAAAESEPNDTAADADAFVSSSPWFANIGTPGDIDYVSFEVTAGAASVEVRVVDVGDGSCTDNSSHKIDTEIEVYDSTNTLVGSNDDASGNYGTCSAYTLTAPAAGTYKVMVKAYYDTKTFPYGLSITQQ